MISIPRIFRDKRRDTATPFRKRPPLPLVMARPPPKRMTEIYASSTSKAVRRLEARNKDIPGPSNGLLFECTEAMGHLTDAATEGLSASDYLNVWVEKKQVPVCKRQCYKLLNKYKAGKSVGWNGTAKDGTARGRPVLASTEEVLEGCRELQRNNSQRPISKKDVASILRGIKERKAIKSGVVDDEEPAKPSDRSVVRYFALVATELTTTDAKKPRTTILDLTSNVD